MKVRILAAALLGLALAAAPSAAAPVWLGAEVGLSVPTGDYKDEASLGLLVGLTGTRMFGGHFGLGGDLAIHSLGVADDFEEAMAAAAGATVDVGLRAIQITTHAKLVLPTKGTVKPYLKGGLGLYNLGSKVEGGSLDVDESETRFGYHLGVGGQAAADAVALSGELAYHSIGTEDSRTNMLTLTVGLHFAVGR
jgi:opacity protein-like surface antigen